MSLIRLSSRGVPQAFVVLLVVGWAVFTACQPSGSSAQISPAEKLFNGKCNSCHALPKPGSKSIEELDGILAKHDKRVKLTPEQREMIVSHLTKTAQSRLVEAK